MSQASPDRLIINLNTSYTPGMQDAGAALHEVQLDLLKKRVREIVGCAKAFKAQLETDTHYSRRHDVITVHGKRGTGKTTFLLNALDHLLSAERRTNAPEDSLGNLCVLGIMDPTLFGQHEHLLLTLLSKIAHKVRSSKYGRGRALCDGRSEECALEAWEKSLRTLAKGLKAIGENRDDLDCAPSGADIHWEDAAYLMEQNMEKAEQGLELERHFHLFLYHSLNILNKDAFVLALDDADTRPAIGWHVLEVLRRYFTSPQLIVILSGDMDLFQTIIEQRHLKVFGLDFTTRTAVLRRFQIRVDGLTEQYLLKILRTQTRISLGSFQSAVEQWQRGHTNGTICVAKNEIKPIPLDDVLQGLYPIFTRRFRNKKCTNYTLSLEQEILRKTLLSNSIRSVSQVLDCLMEYSSVNNCFTIPVVARLCEVFTIPLQRLGFEEPQELETILQSPQGVTMLMKRLFTRNAVEFGLELLPTRSTQDENNALLALQASLSAAMHARPSVLFAYAFKACLLREVLALRSHEMDEPSYARIERYLGLESQELPSTTAARIAGLHRGDPKTGPLRHRGLLRLYTGSIAKNAPLAKRAMYGPEEPPEGIIPPALQAFRNGIHPDYPHRDNALRGWVNTPQTLRQELRCWQRDLMGLGFLDIRRESETYRFFTVFPLLAAMADVLVTPQPVLETLFGTYAQVLGLNWFVRPIYFSDRLEEEQGEEQTQGLPALDEHEADKCRKFEERLCTWREQALQFKSWSFPVPLCARIMSRFFKVFYSIDNDLGNEQTFVGSYAHRCLIAFFNSVLVEEYLLRNDISGEDGLRVWLNAPATTDLLFIRNLRDTGALRSRSSEKTRSNKNKPSPAVEPFIAELDGTVREVNILSDKYPLFKTVFSFPLWAHYLEPAEKLEGTVTKTVYGIYMRLQEADCEDLDPRVVYGDPGGRLASLHVALNSLAIPKSERRKSPGDSPQPDNARKQAVDSPQTECSAEQIRNQKRAGIPLAPKRFPYVKILEDLLATRPEDLALFLDSKTADPKAFKALFWDMVSQYYPHTPRYAYLYTPEVGNELWHRVNKMSQS